VYEDKHIIQLHSSGVRASFNDDRVCLNISTCLFIKICHCNEKTR